MVRSRSAFVSWLRFALGLGLAATLPSGCGPSGQGSRAGLGRRVDIDLDQGWAFQRADVPFAEATALDDSAWTPLDLPHTWNALDGQDGPATPYYRGIGWYRKHYSVPSRLQGQRLYLQFDGSNISTDVFVNGRAAGSHVGGYAAFRFDVTELVTFGGDNVIAVKVNNAAGADLNHELIPESPTVNVPPLSADYTFFGGLYRSVHLLSTPPLAISPMDFGSSGVYVKQTHVSAASAELTITVKLSNDSDGTASAKLRASVLDAAQVEVASATATQIVPARGKDDAVLSTTLTSPHLWDGLGDPYLYSVRVDLLDGAMVLDSITVPLGVRSFSLDADTGFELNGKHLGLHGVNKHQDQRDKGWAIADTDTDADFAIVRELGANAVRLAHYQHAQHTYDLCDRAGLVVWAETPVVNRINDTPEFTASAEQQLTELIRQNYNHPSIVFWSVGNETTLRAGPSPDALIAHLASVVAAEDPTRLAAYAADGTATDSPVNFHGQAHGFNEYQGWYGGKIADFTSWADANREAHPEAPIGITEYGAGASIAEHTADPAAADSGQNHTNGAHAEEYQSYYHESYWPLLQARPFIWGTFVWALFDFASDTREEGMAAGLNDKGLITFDRQTKKDAFYWYKANWSAEKFVHINSRRFVNLPQSSNTIVVYSNVEAVELQLNGSSLSTRTATNHRFVWKNVTWADGANVVEARATTGARTIRDSVTWVN
ncbi:MAG TPA: glycoside hydrolase family 2 TIM barrel-domain containing protein [Polyangiaceae bacterium]|nr:glycoside hydrolase family 2 TIM barrel-domain containing protein [Polyangiaceae bacterium]